MQSEIKFQDDFNMIDKALHQESIKLKEVVLQYILKLHSLEIESSTCSEKCTFRALNYNVYDMPIVAHATIGDNSTPNCVGSANLHICTDKCKVKHSGFLFNTKSLYHMCNDHKVLHICDQAACRAPKVQSGDMCACTWTGNTFQISSNFNPLSHGWIEDEWRYSTENTTCNETHKKDIKAQTKLQDLLAKNELDFCHVKACIEAMFPHHPKRQELNKSTKQHTFRKALHQMEKYHRKCVVKKMLTYSGNLFVTFRESIYSNTNTWKKIQVDPSTAEAILNSHCRNMCKYLQILYNCTDLKIYTGNWKQVICSLLYLSCKSITLNNVKIFINVPLIKLLLPPATQLPYFDFSKTAFTCMKNLIRKVIATALKKNTHSHLTFKFPINNFEDI